MLSDRDYMNRDNRGWQGGGNNRPRQDGTNSVFMLIGINVLIFLLFLGSEKVFWQFGLSAPAIKNFRIWTLLTCMFVHGGFGHLFVNMWGLYLFGTMIAPVMGKSRFLQMYFISGIGGGILWLLFNWHSNIPVVGASGALFGVLIAAAMLYPNKQFLMLFFPVPMKTKTLVLVYAGIEIMMQLSVSDNVAHLAHLGGFLGGYLYVRLFMRREIAWDPLSFISSKASSIPHRNSWRPWTPDNQTDASSDSQVDVDAQVSQKELDRLLNKISTSGINSLSEDEMTILRRAREQMRQR